MAESSCQCISKATVSKAFLNAVTDIKREYEREIDKLNAMLQQKDMQIYDLKESLDRKQEDIQQLLRKLQASQALAVEISNKKDEEIRKQIDRNTAIQENYQSQIHMLNQKYLQKEAELSAVMKCLNSDNFSQSMSTISRKESTNHNKTYSMDIGEYFQDYPERTLKLLNSLPDEKVEDEKEVGDMICMFISRDQMSAEKYGQVNRNFLKRKIKAEQKRFRIVIIYKPNKRQ